MRLLKNLGCPEYLMLVSVAILLLITAKRLSSLSTDNHMSENGSVGSSYKLPDLISQIP